MGAAVEMTLGPLSIPIITVVTVTAADGAPEETKSLIKDDEDNVRFVTEIGNEESSFFNINLLIEPHCRHPPNLTSSLSLMIFVRPNQFLVPSMVETHLAEKSRM